MLFFSSSTALCPTTPQRSIGRRSRASSHLSDQVDGGAIAIAGDSYEMSSDLLHRAAEGDLASVHRGYISAQGAQGANASGGAN